MTTSTTTMTTLARRLQWRSFQTEMRFVWMFEFGTEIGSSIAAIVSKLLKDSQIQSFRMCARLRICKCLRSKILVVVKMHCVCRYWSALACVRSCRIVFSWGIVPSNCYQFGETHGIIIYLRNSGVVFCFQVLTSLAIAGCGCCIVPHWRVRPQSRVQRTQQVLVLCYAQGWGIC